MFGFTLSVVSFEITRTDFCIICMVIQEKVTKQSLMELALSEQLRERQEMEKKLQKLAKTMDYLERAKREEASPLIEAAFQRRLVEERMLHEHEQQVTFEMLLPPLLIKYLHNNFCLEKFPSF